MQQEIQNPEQLWKDAPRPRKDFTGWIDWTQPEGRLTIKAITGYSSDRRRLARCLCSCGVVIEIPVDHVIRQTTRSCGCLKREKLTERNKHRSSRIQHNDKKLIEYRAVLLRNDYMISSLDVMKKIPHLSISQQIRMKELEEQLIPEGIKKERELRRMIGILADSPLQKIPNSRKNLTDWIGWRQPEGYLTIEAITGYSPDRRRLARCRCSCGAEIERLFDNVKRQHVRSCGCKKRKLCNNTRDTIRIELDGELVTLAEASRRTGINRRTLADRLRTGKSGADLFRPPIQSKDNSTAAAPPAPEA